MHGKLTSMANQLRMKVRAPRGATIVVELKVVSLQRTWIDRITITLFPRLPAGSYRAYDAYTKTDDHRSK